MFTNPPIFSTQSDPQLYLAYSATNTLHYILFNEYISRKQVVGVKELVGEGFIHDYKMAI